jgi:phosphonate transport system ATP-binding protein
LLKVEHLTKVYPNGTEALKDVSFSVDDGEFLVIIGLSGSGKSTLLRCINRLIDPTEGQVFLDNVDVTKASASLDRVGIKDKAHSRADALSGGQQQRVGIARTLMQEPKLILADEPVASLDPVLSHSILRYLEQLNKEGITVLCSLHFLDLVHRYATRVIALKDGVKVFEGFPKEINREKFKEIYGEEAQEVRATTVEEG